MIINNLILKNKEGEFSKYIDKNYLEALKLAYKKTILERAEVIIGILIAIAIMYFTGSLWMANGICVTLMLLAIISAVEIFKNREVWSKNCNKNQGYYLEIIYYKRLLFEVVIIGYLGALTLYVDYLKNPWRGLGWFLGGYESSFLIASFIILIYLIIEIILNFIRKKVFEVTMENMEKAIKRGAIKEVKENLTLEFKNNIIWGSGYSIAYIELVKLIEKVENLILEEEKLFKERGEIITNASHDIKTPLTSISNYIDILKNKEITTLEREKFTKNLIEKINLFNNLIDDFSYSIDLAKTKENLNFEFIDINQLLEDVIKSFELDLKEKSLTIEKNINVESSKIKVDKKITFRIFQNLISNIVKYAKNNSIVNIEIINSPQGEIIIKISNEVLEKIDIEGDKLLERFIRADLSRNIEGSGLGLNIAKSLIEMEGGNIEINIQDLIFQVILKFNISN